MRNLCIYLLSVLFGIFVLTACSDKEASHDMAEMSMESPVMEPSVITKASMMKERVQLSSDDNDISVSVEGAPIVTSGQAVERKLIKTGRLVFETENIDTTFITIQAAIKRLNGYIENENEYKTRTRLVKDLRVRIPANNFDHLLDEVTDGVKKIDNKTINVADVTEEFVDQEARLNVKKSLLQRYEDLLLKAKNVEDMINIEREMGTLQAEIESIEGRLRYLSNQVSMSSLDISFYQQTSISEEKSSLWLDIKYAFLGGWNSFISFTVLLISLWPYFILLVVILALVIKKLRKKV